MIAGAALGTVLTLPFFMMIATLVFSAVTRRPLDSIDETAFRTPLFWVIFIPSTILFWTILFNS